MHCYRCLHVLNRFRIFTFRGHFDFEQEPEVPHTVPDTANKVNGDTPLCFYSTEIALQEEARDMAFMADDAAIAGFSDRFLHIFLF